MSDVNDLRAPFPYFGGKGKQDVLQKVWSRLGYVDNYYEPFFGSGAMLLGRPDKHFTDKRPNETVNDLDVFVANFWRALAKDPLEVAHYADWPVSELDLHARHKWLMENKKTLERVRADLNFYDAKMAGWWVWGASAWIGGGWCAEPAMTSDGMQGVNRQAQPMPTLNRTGINRDSIAYPEVQDDENAVLFSVSRDRIQNRIDRLQSYFTDLHIRMRDVQVLSGDWKCVLGPGMESQQGITAVFLDPPYGDGKMDYASGGNRDISVAQEVALWCFENGNNPNYKIVYCGYDGAVTFPTTEYLDDKDNGWYKLEWKANGGYGGKGNKNSSRERLWFNRYAWGDLTLQFRFPDK